MCFPSRRVVCGITCVVWVAAFSWNLAHAADQAAPAEVSAEQARFFEQHVRPLLIQKCQKCHGADKQSGNLRLDSRGALLLGGDSGPAIVPGSAAESLLVEAINYESYEMPPDGKLDASGSPWISSLPLNSAMAVPSPVGARKLSCFSAVSPVSG